MADKDTTTTTTTVAPDDGWGAKTIKKYSKLAIKLDYDHEAAEQLAEAINEIAELELKVQQLKQLSVENKELMQYIWRSESGAIATHNLTDEHLTAIMMHVLRNGRPINRAIRGEAMSRGLTIPANVRIDWSDQESYNQRMSRLIDRGDI